MKFELFLPERVIFHPGGRTQIGEAVLQYGRDTVLFHSKSHPSIPEIIDRLQQNQIRVHCFAVSGEPTLDSIEAILREIGEDPAQSIVSVGGGSVIDAGKAVSALLTNKGDPRNYLEVVGKNLPLKASPLPFIAVPTTAGTGSEATKNAVISVPDMGVKVSLRSNSMIPRVAIIDPELSFSMPQSVAASTGMDALVQLIEPYLSIKSNIFCDGICRQGLTIGASAIRSAVLDKNDFSAKSGMCFASFCGGIALANSGLGAVHGFAGVIGGMKGIPHGMICAALLAGVLKTNIKAIEARQPDDPVLQKFQEISVILTKDPAAAITDSVSWAENMGNEIGIPRLSQMGIARMEFVEICEKSARSSSMKGNPVQLTPEELLEILDYSF